MAIEKWELSYAPSSSASGRFKLRFRGKTEEIQKLIQTLPISCEKPFVTLSQDYNWAIFVHLTSGSEKEQLIQTLKDFSPNGEILEPDIELKSGDVESEISAISAAMPSQEFLLNALPLDPNLSFEKFAICPQNRFAHAAAVAIAESPGKIYNPFLVFGQSGTGKTHLIQAVAHRVLLRNPETKFLLISADYFKEKTDEAIQNRQTEFFRSVFEELDLLLMEDIEVLSGHSQSERELLFFMNLFLARQAQLVFSSKLHPSQIENLDEKLKLRLEAGLVIELPTPFAETRMAILKKKSEEMQLELEPEVLTFLSELLIENVDELEGLLKKIHAHIHLQKGLSDLESIKNLLSVPTQSKVETEATSPPLEVTTFPAEPMSEENKMSLSKNFESFSQVLETPVEIVKEPALKKTEQSTEKKSEKPVPLEPIPDSELVPVKIACFYPKDAQSEWNSAKERWSGVIRKYRLKFKLAPTEIAYDPESNLKFSFFSDTCKTQESSFGLVLGTPADSVLEKKAFFSGLQKHFAGEKIPYYFVSWTEKDKDQKFLSIALDISLNLKR